MAVSYKTEKKEGNTEGRKKERKKKKTEKKQTKKKEKKNERRTTTVMYASRGIVRKHTCNVRRQLQRRNAHGAKRVLLVLPRAPAFSPLVYLCKYSPSIYNNTRVLCAPRGGGGGTRHGHMPRKITVIAD